jgi:hypothetical protein
MPEPKVCTDGGAVTVREPFSIRRRGGRKLVLAPDGTAGTWAAPRRHVDNAMVKAIARAFRWRQMLEDGAYNTIAEIAVAEKINESYVGRVLRLTLLARIWSSSPQWAASRPHCSWTAYCGPFPLSGASSERNYCSIKNCPS